MSLTFIKQLLSPASVAPDGLTASEVNAKPPTHSGLLADMFSTARSGHLNRNAATVVQGLITMVQGKPLDDRELLLEHGVSLLQSLPPDSDIGKKAADGLIGMLWKDLPHPPAAYVGKSNIYRAADGSGNNRQLPDLGKSGTPYSRSVPAVRPKPPNLPDPGLVYDLLLKRQEFKPHPSGLSSMFFAFATCVHECFQTDLGDPSINTTTSYVDLSTIYGNNQAEQDSVRTRDGKGTIHPDTIACARIMMMPPSVVAILIIFSRNHNHIASRLLQINEKGEYTQDIASLSPEKLAAQDEDIFQRARNVNVGWFASIVLGDYVATILNTYRADSLWSLNLGAEIKERSGERVSRGGGNAVSCEFSVLYHWHASLSQKDDAYVTKAFEGLFKKPVTEITPEEFWAKGSQHNEALRKVPPTQWPIRGLQRGPDGRFKDEDIAGLLKNAVDEAAGAFGAHGSPQALRVVEIMGMNMARTEWGVCTMNEFRNYLNLKPFDSFEEWNPDPVVAEAARTLYGHIEDLELYPGLLAEEAKPAMPGSGVCPGHTIGRGILDDAVSLIRSDRFLTHDFNVNSLTSWGFAQLKPNPGARGGLLASLLFTNLPFEYNFNSTYAMFPFYTPAATSKILQDLKVRDQYDFSKDRAKGGTLKSLKSFEACKAAFLDKETYRVFYNDAILQVTNNKGFLIGFDDEATHNKLRAPFARAFHQTNFRQDVMDFFTAHITAGVKKSSIPLPGTNTYHLDIARDVTNIVAVQWVAHKFGIPLKTEEHPRGLLSVQELRMMFVGLFVFSSFNVIPAAGWLLRETSVKTSKALLEIIKKRLTTASGIKDAVLETVFKGTSWDDSDESSEFYQTLMKDKSLSVDELAAGCLGLAIPIAGNLTQQVTLLVDTILRPEYEAEAKEIARLAKSGTGGDDALLSGYIREFMRINPIVVGLPRVAAKDVSVQDGAETVDLKAGDRVLIGISKAHLDPVAFPEPEKIDPYRPASAYILLGTGMHFCFGDRLTEAALLASIKTIFSLPNLRRGPGKSGQLNPLVQDLAGLDAKVYLDQNCRLSPAPVSLHVRYDAAIGSPVFAEVGIPSPVRTNSDSSSGGEKNGRRTSIFGKLKSMGSPKIGSKSPKQG
ncbi:linoleate diol synthase [Pseudohyphozyma bogoriensis]|nr:linoleate diol synthase [Pseudohyphozyma bogoriensis]